jgi:hypothetical protein
MHMRSPLRIRSVHQAHSLTFATLRSGIAYLVSILQRHFAAFCIFGCCIRSGIAAIVFASRGGYTMRIKDFDREYIFCPDMPDVKYIVDYRRKVVSENLDAYPGADLVMRIGRKRV